MLLCLLITAAAVVWYFLSAAADSPDAVDWPGGSSAPGLAFGIGGGLIILFEFLLWPRRFFRRWRIGSARAWMRAHIWLGLLTVPLLVLHSGFQLGGLLSTWLSIAFVIVIASGLVGLWLQQWLPKRMLRTVESETVFTQIDVVAELFVAEADDIVDIVCGSRERVSNRPQPVAVGAGRVVGAVRRPARILPEPADLRRVPNSEPLEEIFRRAIRPFLLGHRDGSGLRDRDNARQLFDQLRRDLDAEAHVAVSALEECCEHRRQLDLQARLHWWLHSWLAIHLPLSAALIILMLVHAWLGIRYMTG